MFDKEPVVLVVPVAVVALAAVEEVPLMVVETGEELSVVKDLVPVVDIVLE